MGTGVLGITGACAPRPVTQVGSGGSVCVKARESRVTLAMALERKCARVMTRSAQVHDQNFFLFPSDFFQLLKSIISMPQQCVGVYGLCSSEVHSQYIMKLSLMF